MAGGAGAGRVVVGTWLPPYGYFPKERICLTPNAAHFSSQCLWFPAGSLTDSIPCHRFARAPVPA